MSWSGIPYAIEAILGERKKRDEIRDKAMKKLRASTTGDRTMIDLNEFADRLTKEMTKIERKARDIAEKAEEEHGLYWAAVESAKAGIIEGERRMLDRLREPTEAWVTTVAKEIAASDGVPEHAPPGHYLRNAKVAFKAIADAFEKERGDGQ